MYKTCLVSFKFTDLLKLFSFFFLLYFDTLIFLYPNGCFEHTIQYSIEIKVGGGRLGVRVKVPYKVLRVQNFTRGVQN